MEKQSSLKLSVVTTLYKSAAYVEEFHRRISQTAQKITNDYEIIFVNDGSPDDSFDIAVRLYWGDPCVRVIDLSKNFGHHKAMMTGLSYSSGEYIFLVDVDLEEEPETLLAFWNELNRSPHFDVVYGVQESRKGSWFEKLSGNLFYWCFNKLSNVSIPRNLVTARLMTRRYVEALTSFGEQEIFMAGLWASAGFVQKPLTIKKLDHSPSSYNLGRKISIFINSITSFSNKPLIFVFYFGSIITFFSFCYISYLVYRKMTVGINVSGWSSIMASIWFIGGVIIFSIGIVGIYLSKIFSETKRRPYTIIRSIYGTDEKHSRKHK